MWLRFGRVAQIWPSDSDLAMAVGVAQSPLPAPLHGLRYSELGRRFYSDPYASCHLATDDVAQIWPLGFEATPLRDLHALEVSQRLSSAPLRDLQHVGLGQ